MPPAEIKQLRTDLGITQIQLASLLDVHPITVSKWERARTKPDAYQSEMMRRFRQAGRQQPGIGEMVAAALVGAGVAFAIFKLLEAAFGGEEGKT